MKRYVREGTETFANSPKNNGKYYLAGFALTFALMVVLYLGLLDTSSSGGRGRLFLVFLPFTCLYALAMFSWYRFGRIEICLGDKITKRMKLGRVCFSWERWLWPDIHSVWAQKVKDDVPDHSQLSRKTVYLKYDRYTQVLLGNLTLDEADSLCDAIAVRLKLRRTV